MRKPFSLSLLSVALFGCSSAVLSDGWSSDTDTSASSLGGVQGSGETLLATVPVLTPCGPSPGTPFSLRSDSWGYEVVPSVVGPGEAFYIEVTAPVGTVTSITLENANVELQGIAGLTFKDDGTGRDRVAGDGVFTSSPLWFGGITGPRMLSGLGFTGVGMLRAHLPNATTRDFLQDASIGFLEQTANRQPAVQTATRAATSYVAEACTSGWQAQASLRFNNFTTTPAMTGGLYEVVNDDVDHWVWFSTQHLEQTNRLYSENFAAGRHMDVWRQFTGSQLFPMDDRSVYGTAALRSVNFLDSASRGVFAANVTHEILHSWGAYLQGSLGLVEGTGHYHPWSSVGSLLGGFKWDRQPNGKYTRNCDQGRNRATQASELDRYFMGLLPASSVTSLRIAPTSQPLAGCGQVVPTPHTVVTVQQIIGAHGAVTPGPGQAPTNYRVGFAVEASGRRLTPNEREFYHRLGEAYTAPLPGGPLPSIGENWASIAGFFPGSTWRSNLTTH